MCVAILHVSVWIAGRQQEPQCTVDGLPFGDRLQGWARPDNDRWQAIVPAYTFQCSGRVTEWRACIDPGRSPDFVYYIQFQVWRRNGSADECYELVGSNQPEPQEFLPRIGDDDDDPLWRCVFLSVSEEHQIEFQSGDVVGYYADRSDNRGDEGGIQWTVDGDSEVVVHYREDLPREDRQSYYAIGGPNPTECGFPISGDTNLYSLSASTSGSPIISLSIGKSNTSGPCTNCSEVCLVYQYSHYITSTFSLCIASTFTITWSTTSHQ